nr:MAG TPA: histidine kinase-like protein [Microviridae sp.]
MFARSVTGPLRRALLNHQIATPLGVIYILSKL